MPQSISAVAAAALGVQVIAAILWLYPHLLLNPVPLLPVLVLLSLLWLLVAATVRMPSEMGLGLMSVSPKQTAKSWAGIFRYVPAKI